MAQQDISRFFTVKKPVKISKDNENIQQNKTTQVKGEKLQAFAYNKACNYDDGGVKQNKLKLKPLKRPNLEQLDGKKKKAKVLTDFEQQILDFKLNHMDKLLFIQSGYRYKFFGEDAKIASKLLNIKLTQGKLSYNLEKPAENDHLYSSFAQASIPVERLLVHVRRLVVRGYKVGVVDQIETAAIRAETKNKTKVFDRYLSNVYSGGTFINDEDLEKNVNGKSIICLNEAIDGKISIVSVNVYFSEIIYDEFFDDFTRFNLESRLHHLEPIEIITLGDTSQATLTCLKNFKKFNDINTGNLNHIHAEDLQKSFGEILTDIKVGLGDNQAVFSFLSNLSQPLLKCFCKLFDYLKEFDLTSVFEFIFNFKKFSDVDKNTILDCSALKNLEIFYNITTGTEKGSLFEIVDYSLTKFGQRLLKNWLGRPLVDKTSIIDRQDAVNTLINKMNGLQIERIKNLLKGCPDMELILSRIHYGRSNRKEVYLFLKKVTEILNVFKNMREDLISNDVLNSSLLTEFFINIKNMSSAELYDMDSLVSMINSPYAIDSKSVEHITSYFHNSFYDYEKIQAQNNEIERIHELLEEELENLRIFTKNKDLQYVKVNNEPFLIQIRKSNIKNVPSDWIRISATLNCARYRSPEAVKLYKKLQYHEDVLKQICNELFLDFTKRINSYYPHISKLIKQLASFDALMSLATASLNNYFTKPKIVDIPTIQLKGARNPITERLLQGKSSFLDSTLESSQGKYTNPSTYIDNDFFMQEKQMSKSRIALITGPNMGGKSSFMRQVGLIVILSQIGCFVPCNEGTILGIFSNICIRLGSNDDIFAGKSTFQVELTECHHILQTCVDTGSDPDFPRKGKPGNSLILMDELGRGTSTADGCSIAWSVLDYLINDMSENVLVLFVTHFKELEVFENRSLGVVKNYHMGYKIISGEEKKDIINTNILFTYKLTPGYSSGSYGVYCAKIAGIPNGIVSSADEISQNAEAQTLKRDIQRVINTINNKNVGKLIELADSF